MLSLSWKGFSSIALLFFTASFQPEQPTEVAQPGHAAAGCWEPERGHITWTKEEESWTPSSSVAHSVNW